MKIGRRASANAAAASGPEKEAELAAAGTPPHVAVAPGLLDAEYVAIRSDNDADMDYGARRRLLAAALASAHNG